MRAMTADYMGQDRSGMPIQSRVIAVLSSQGSGVVVLGFARAGGATALAPALDAVVQGLEVTGPPVVNQQAVAALRGKWMAYSGRADGGSSVLGSTARSAEETVEFDGRDRFAYASSATVSVSTPGMGGMAGGASAANDQGTYTVIGTTLVVRGQRGMWPWSSRWGDLSWPAGPTSDGQVGDAAPPRRSPLHGASKPCRTVAYIRRIAPLLWMA
jgi:hypothetical protein